MTPENRQSAKTSSHEDPIATRRERLLYGTDPTERIVAVEKSGDAAMTLFLAGLDSVREPRMVPFAPWLLAERPEPWAAIRPKPDTVELAGNHPFRFLITFAGWSAYLNATRAARDSGESFFRFRSPVEQFLVRTGMTLFKGLIFDDLHRVQIDIETLGLDPTVPDSSIIAVALSSNRDKQIFLINHGSEAALLQQVCDWLIAEDPDVIEGHNIFNFDLPYLVQRASMAGISLNWGRDGSSIWIGTGKQRFKAGALSLPYTPANIFGRHIIDTYQQIQRYDVGGKLRSYALKRVIAALYPDRVRELIPGEQIRDVWQAGDVARLEAYNLADVEDVATLSRLTVPTEFYQTQLVPRGFQSVATGGPGEKINDLMVRAYLSDGHSVPKAEPPRTYPGGYAELLETGAFRPVIKCDVESLYPSIMLTNHIASKRDELGAALPMLGELTERRLHAKSQARVTTGDERDIWDGLQSSFKVLINSFYGYLGYGGGLFNDYDAAANVTIAGQGIIQQVVAELQRRGAIPIEVDTDGVYFVPPHDVRSPQDGERFVDEIGRGLPGGIRLAHDGSYAGMLSLKLKNYALLNDDGSLTLHGSALRSRQVERCFRAFLETGASGFVRDERETVRDAYFTLANQIRERQLVIPDFSQWRMINEETLSKQTRLKLLVDELGGSIRGGERVETYERSDGSLGLAEQYANDESVPYLLRRLRDCAARFAPLFESEAAFSAFFPAISARTDMTAARKQTAQQQLSLFG